MAFPTMWSQKALVSLTKKGGGTPINYQCLLETIDIDEGDKDIEETVTLCGGRLIKIMPQALSTVTFEGYPVGIGVTQATDLGFSQQFNATSDTGQPLETYPTTESDMYRVAIMWCSSPTITQAHDAIASSTTAPISAYRWVAHDTYITSNKKAFTDGGLKFTVSVKCPQFDKAGQALIYEQETDGSQELTALSTTY